MASTTLTYGKKRSLLRSLGSRRRQQRIFESLPNNNNGTTPTIGEETQVPTRKRSFRHATSIEEMASRLLDDTTSIAEACDVNSTAIQIRDSDKLTSSATSPESTTMVLGHAASLSQKPKRSEKRTSSPESRPRSARVEKHSIGVSIKSSRQAGLSHGREDPFHRRKENGLQRPLQSNAVNLDPLKTRPLNHLKPSNSVPLGVVDGNIRKVEVQRGLVEPAGPEEINQKLQAMLEATSALKPPTTPQVSNPPTSAKLTRMVSTSKMFAKVTHAWDRLHFKASMESPKPQNPKDAQFDNGKATELSKPMLSPLPYHTPLSPISTIEIRLNEGDNLNKKKVQRIVGGQVSRKPVAGDGKSLRSGKSLDDPFSENGGIRSPTSFESRLKQGAASEDDKVPPLPCSPFESEKGFDKDIEDRILSTTPVGSSTPRIRVDRVPPSGLDDSPKTRQSMSTNLTVDPSLDRVAVKSAREELTHARLLPITTVRASDRKLVNPTSPVRRGLADTTPYMLPRPKGVKKHPSPSKETLEDLEKAFRKYTSLRAAGIKSEDIDELAASFVALTPPLQPRDKNRRSVKHLSVCNFNDHTSPSAHKGHRQRSSSSSVRISRNSRSVENALKIHGEIRLVTSFRPAGSGADEVDELH